ncbi:hypothetical protein M9H77_26043 [Catharanthus roseus]|uniref:Uncharacterized protein n=1 Tax=Catharanthus roseus TaxID=4058 RepID=A0ACC0A8N7_CATRO|nr:hypothetical protein M9H77_26043 [Catharanthus roseus]
MANLYIAGPGLLQIFILCPDVVACSRNPNWRFDHEPIPTLGGFLINNCKRMGTSDYLHPTNHQPTIWKSVYTWRETPENKFEKTFLMDLQGLGEFGTLLLPGHCHHPIQID